LPEQQFILDYASPRPRGRVRLPAESRIEIQGDRDSTTIIESLKGKETAIAAIIFAVFVLMVLLVAIVAEWPTMVRQHRDALVLPVTLCVLWIAEATVGVLVLDQTYRTTILRVRDGELALIFRGLFSRTKEHHWPIGEIGELRVETTQSGPGIEPLAELQIRPARDVSVHLFTDHREMEVQHIAGVITRALSGEHNIPFSSQSIIVTPDEATFNRLLSTKRLLREVDRANRIGD
jgi:hypothetical protein